MADTTNPAAARKLDAGDWLSTLQPWTGHFDGTKLGVNVTVLNFTQEKAGDGPPLHVHDYDEIFIIRHGHALFRIGDTRIEAKAGDVVLGPATVPHTFKNIGTTPLETIDIHLSDTWVQVDLPDEDPDW